MDGDVNFSLLLDFEDGSKIRAGGRNSFPTGFSDIENEIYRFLDYIKKNKYSIALFVLLSIRICVVNVSFTEYTEINSA